MGKIDRRAVVVGLLGASVPSAAHLSSSARAESGAQPMRIIFPFAAGGSGDALARLLAEHMRVGLDRAVIVENRTGAAGRIGVQAVKSAPPDGQTILLTPIAPVAIYQHVYDPLGYDPVADLQPLAQVATFEFALAVGPQVPAKTLRELVAWLSANPSAANYGTPAAGTLPHFFAVSFGRASGLDLRHVGYRGSANALTDLVAGQISMVFTTTSDLLEMHKAGRIQILATSDAQRSPLLPDIPTFKEEGYAIQGTSWYAMYAPARTPAEIVTRLNRVIIDALRRPEVKEQLLALGLYATGTSPEDLAKIQRADSELWAPAIKASGFTPKQ
jgi:tripartite-type tricarboxylate transporter receptor subunit TctC